MNDNQQPVTLAQIQNAAPRDTITLLEALGILWHRKFTVLFFVLLGAVVGVLLALWSLPQFTSDALFQVNLKGNKASKAMGEMGALFEMTTPADAEIQLIKSRMVLSYVVEAEHLAYAATPTSKLDRLLHKQGRMDLEYLQIPKIARAERWTAVATGVNTYAVYTPENAKIVEGNVGDMLVAPYADDTLKVRVKLMRAAEGERFALVQKNPLTAVRGLSKALSVGEVGKMTGIISVRYSNRYADRAASILNTVANTYLRQNVEMRSAEAEKTLGFLEKQLPDVKAKLDSSEKILSNYRHEIGSVDMSGETQAHLEKEMDLQKRLLALEQQRQEAVRLFKEEHPTVKTIVNQQNEVRNALNALKEKAATMPLRQQEILRLQEEVQVNNVQYTSMLNNIQQLRVVRAGEVGNVRIVDFAQIEPKPSKPKKFNIFICSVAAGFMVGVLFVFLLRLRKSGVRSANELERETDVAVYAKIPQSARTQRNRKRGQKSLVELFPNDPASEAFRSLLTAMDFSIDNSQKVVMVCGLIPGVGKSFVSKNLSTVWAMSGKKVVLVDADIRRGVHGKSKQMGLAEILTGKADWRAVVSTDSCEGLSVIAGGKNVVAPSELLRHEKFKNFIDELKAEYDLVIIDTPPLSLVTDAMLVYPHADFVLFVLQYGCHSMEEIKECLGNLKRFGEKPGAFVMNRCEHEPGHYYGYGYGYGYYGKGYYTK